MKPNVWDSGIKNSGAGNVGKAIAGTIVGGVARHRESRRSAQSHADAKDLITHTTSETIRLSDALSKHGTLSEVRGPGGVGGKFHAPKNLTKQDNQVTGELSAEDTQKKTNADPNTVSRPIEPGAQHGGKAPGRVKTAGAGAKHGTKGPGSGTQLHAFTEKGNVSKHAK